jgi:NDP-sugar pyrophosphorylase family protein
MRLNPLTNDVPLSLLSVPGGTLLDYSLWYLQDLGIAAEDTAILLQYRGDQIARYLAGALHPAVNGLKEHRGNGTGPLLAQKSSQRPRIKTIPQNPPFTYLSALASAAGWADEPTLVIHGNSYFSRPLESLVSRGLSGEPVFLLEEEHAARGRVAGAGAYVLPPELFQAAKAVVERVPDGSLDDLLAFAGVGFDTVSLDSWAHHVNTPTDLLLVNRYLLKNFHEAMHPPQAGIGYDALNYNWISPNAEVIEPASFFFATVAAHAKVTRSHLYNVLVMPYSHLTESRERHTVLAPTANSLLRLYAPATAFPVAGATGS